jgi:hypothetical protein
MFRLNRRSYAGVAAMLTMASVAAGAGNASAQPTSAPHWRIVKTFGPSGANSSLAAVTATGPGDAWTAGEFCTGCPKQIQLGVAHWNGKRWSMQSLPAKIARHDYAIYSLGASSAKDVWIIAGATSGGFVAVRWNGKKWTATSLPSWVVRRAFGSGVTDNTAVTFGPKNVWDFSLGADALPTVAARFDGHTWRKAYLPGVPLRVSAVAANDIWVVAATKKTAHLPLGHHTNILMHWNGHSWKSITIPMPHSTFPGGFVDGLVGQGPKDAWIGVPTGGQIGSLRGELLHWNGAKWTHVSVPRGVFNVTTGAPVVPDGNGGVWMQGYGSAPPYPLHLYHYSHGRWTSELMPGGTHIFLQGFSWIPGTRSVWAVGLDVTGPGNTTKAVVTGYGV